MKKVIRTVTKAVKNFIVNSINCFAPYTVQNVDINKPHYAWTWNGAMQWVKCYDSDNFGTTGVFNFNGELIASKG